MTHRHTLLVRLALLLAGAVAMAPPSSASLPVERTLAGCVVDNTFYSVNGRAYRIRVDAHLDLRPFEGQAVHLPGLLHPGDYFRVDPGAKPEAEGACPPAAMARIHKERSVRLRVGATTAAKAGHLDQARDLIARAMAILSPVECDTYTDRAYILALQGDSASVARDLAILGERKCAVDGQMNWLLLQDLGELLVAKGQPHAAVEALELALAACDEAHCLSRPDIAAALEKARGTPKPGSP